MKVHSYKEIQESLNNRMATALKGSLIDFLNYSLESSFHHLTVMTIIKIMFY
jgi:hypothetical protein